MGGWESELPCEDKKKKRINTVRKGNYQQLKCRKALEAMGWVCYTARRGYMGQPIDFFGLYDLICYYPLTGQFKLIQVKSNKCGNDVREAIKAFKTDGYWVQKEIWIYKNYARKPIIEEIL